MNSHNIPIIESISYEEFCTEFLEANQPCVFTSELTSHWKCRKDWVTNQNTPNWDFLQTNFGDALVPVANCSEEYYNSNPKQDMKLKDYVTYCKQTREEADPELLYLKDWHFMIDFPDYYAYQMPIYFMSDWLNEYWVKTRSNGQNHDDDYRFVYIGCKGTSTPLHSDVFGSYSWSANVCGKKKWILIAPGSEETLKQLNGGIFPRDIEQIDCGKDKVGAIELIQSSGEVIFVPSGWIHQVVNLEDTISVNHNWFNAYNIEHVWHNMLSALDDVHQELSDIKGECDVEEWEDKSQLILKLHHGMNCLDLLDILSFIAKKYTQKRNATNFNYLFRPNNNQIYSLKRVLNAMIHHQVFSSHKSKIEKLLEDLKLMN